MDAGTIGGLLVGIVGAGDARERLDHALRAPEAPDREDLALLAVVAALRLDPSDVRDPLTPVLPGRLPGVADLTQAHLDRLRDVAPAVPVADLRARCWDILWLRARRDAEAARSAHRAYLEAAAQLARVDASAWDTPASRLRRALAIAKSLKQREDAEAVGRVAEEIVRDERASALARVAVADILAEWKGDRARTAASIALKLAEDALATLGAGGFDWDWVRYALGVAATGYRLAGDADAASAARAQRADTFIRQADWLAARPGASRFLVADRLRCGIQARRDLGESSNDVKELHLRLLQVQAEATKELAHHETKQDITALVHRAREAVTEKAFTEALVTLAHLPTVPRLADIYAEAEASLARFPLQFLFPRVSVDRRGRTLSAVSGDGQPALEAYALERAAVGRGLIAGATINPAREVVRDEHAALVEDWISFLLDRPLVDPRRVRSLALGLSAGLRGDWLVSTALLVPQVEHLLRTIVAANGGTTSTIAPDGTQKDVLLSTLLQAPELRDVLGEDLVFDLRGLLEGSGGGNLRNRHAHGLMTDAEVCSTDALYLWFSVLRVLVLVERGTPRPEEPGD